MSRPRKRAVLPSLYPEPTAGKHLALTAFDDDDASQERPRRRAPTVVHDGGQVPSNANANLNARNPIGCTHLPCNLHLFLAKRPLSQAPPGRSDVGGLRLPHPGPGTGPEPNLDSLLLALGADDRMLDNRGE